MLFVSMVTAAINPAPCQPPLSLFLSAACHMVLQVTSEGLIWTLLNARHPCKFTHTCMCVCVSSIMQGLLPWSKASDMLAEREHRVCNNLVSLPLL